MKSNRESRPLGDLHERPGDAAAPEPVGTRLYEGLLRVVIGAAEVIGIDPSLRLGRGVGRIWFVLGAPRVKRVSAQLAFALPEMPTAERSEATRAVFEHLGQGIAELVLMLGRHRSALLSRVEVSGISEIEAALRAEPGKGIVIVTAHLGNWELYGAKLAAAGIPVSFVHRGLQNRALDRALRRVRAAGEQAHGIDVDQIKMDRRAGVRFVRALEAGRCVVALLDQHAGRDEGMTVDFFGHPAKTRFGPLRLAARTRAQIALAYGRRDAESGRHQATIEAPREVESALAHDDSRLLLLLQEVTRGLEREIRRSPSQWIWTHRRWRTHVRRGDSKHPPAV